MGRLRYTWNNKGPDLFNRVRHSALIYFNFSVEELSFTHPGIENKFMFYSLTAWGSTDLKTNFWLVKANQIKVVTINKKKGNRFCLRAVWLRVYLRWIYIQHVQSSVIIQMSRGTFHFMDTLVLQQHLSIQCVWMGIKLNLKIKINSNSLENG